jgi:pyruvate dehydrogenase E1 component alpha subunit
MHMSMGQEAVAVAVCEALGPEGLLFGFYRSHALFLAKTDDGDRFFGELYGKVTGTAHGKAGSMHLAAPDRGLLCASAVVGASIPLAVGAAFTQQRRGSGVMSCAYFGDGALEEGVFWESLNLACVMRLPVLFLCEDNGLAVHTRPEVRHGFAHIEDVVRQFHCGVFTEDSTDVEVLCATARRALEASRAEGRPAFLRVRCYRYLGHIGITEDFDAGYRSRQEFEPWHRRDPLALQRRRLLDQGWSAQEVTSREQRISAALEEGVRRAEAAPLPPPEELCVGVFHETA